MPIQWLSDNGSMYTALDILITAERLHLVPITTPAASPQSNGMSEAFVNTLRRDYLAGADLSTAAVVLDQIPAWIADYHAVAPHLALGFQSPHQFRSAQLVARPRSSEEEAEFNRMSRNVAWLQQQGHLRRLERRQQPRE